ncbi:Chloroperoxidase [Crucibulum laeve]|uniref:Chloroperoxidase n=1 Tax=Crucibulum laeve TaxID=68775 RepID=A0A5C3MGW3_9AGAR|nr:Chloroperoxidase [Crucibulum laeve]
MFLITPIAKILQDLTVLTWDFWLTMYNLITPKRRIGHVVPEGHPGFGGQWPEYISPKEGDSRCSCPAINAMANHGILPRDGRNISFTELGKLIRATYNFSPSFCFFVPNFAANMLKKSYRKDTFDLSELDLHNGIEHDGSLLREDSALVPDQGEPHIPFIKELLASATGKDKDGNPLLTPADLSRYSAKRRVDARATNPHFTLSTFHKIFGSSNSSTLLTIFGGRVKDLEPILIEERLPEGWESRIRGRMGLTMTTFNKTVLRVELGINEKKYIAENKQNTLAGPNGDSTTALTAAETAV